MQRLARTRNILIMDLQLMIPLVKRSIAQDFLVILAEGTEPVSYKFENAGKYTDIVTIYGVLFQTVDPDQANFTMTAKP